MSLFLVLASMLALTVAEPPAPNYGAPSAPSYSAPVQSYGAPSSGYGAPSSDYGAPSGGQVFRHVYVHAAADEPTHTENKVVRVPGGGDKHVNIIFVKAPSSSSKQLTEVILPEQDEQKNIVYVLVKKAESSSDVKIRAPAAQRPSKPEVFFIRYKGAEQGGYGAPAPASPSYGAPPAPASPSYGAPSAPPARSYGAPSGGY